MLGLANDDSQGQWGGVVLLGRAPITDCTVAPAATPGSVNCERQTEGAVDPAYFGGATANDNSGTIDYVQIRYSGYVLSGNSELQSLTLGGVGIGDRRSTTSTRTTARTTASRFSAAAPTLRHIVVTGADDDNIDVDTGYQGTIQYVIAVQKTSGGRGLDDRARIPPTRSEDNTPRTHMKLANFTFVHRNPASGNTAAMLFRGKSDATLVNGVVTSPMACLRLNGTNILTADAPNQKTRAAGVPVGGHAVRRGGALRRHGWRDRAAGRGRVQCRAPTTTRRSPPASTSTFVNGANETAVTATDPKTLDAAFDTTTYVGAVQDASDTWYAGWTCNSATAKFGTTSTACTSLPVAVNR